MNCKVYQFDRKAFYAQRARVIGAKLKIQNQAIKDIDAKIAQLTAEKNIAAAALTATCVKATRLRNKMVGDVNA